MVKLLISLMILFALVLVVRLLRTIFLPVKPLMTLLVFPLDNNSRKFVLVNFFFAIVGHSLNSQAGFVQVATLGYNMMIPCLHLGQCPN